MTLGSLLSDVFFFFLLIYQSKTVIDCVGCVNDHLRRTFFLFGSLCWEDSEHLFFCGGGFLTGRMLMNLSRKSVLFDSNLNLFGSHKMPSFLLFSKINTEKIQAGQFYKKETLVDI